MEKLVCCIHIVDEETGDIRRFTESTLERCHMSLKVRKFQNLNYSTFELPTSTNGVEGYHKQCYSRFTAIKTKYVTSVPLEWPGTAIHQSGSPNTSKAGDLQEVRIKRSRKPQTTIEKLGKMCIFCGKSRMKYKKKE